MKVLLLAPSAGLGGGIERYAAAVESVLAAQGVPYERLNLRDPGTPLTLANRIRFALTVRRTVHRELSAVDELRVVLLHRNLLPVLGLLAPQRHGIRATVVLHGSEIWQGRRIRARYWLRRPYVRALAASSFTAGVLARVCPVRVLAPGLPSAWYDTLVRAGMAPREPHEGLHLLTAFRLSAWRDKGLETVLSALRLLEGGDRVRLTVCGSGPVPDELRERLHAVPNTRLLPGASDRVLADELAAADVFVLASRTRAGARPSGEGFGLVLVEAQLAGTTVIAPAFGGSADAFQPDLTGVSPVDESAQALAAELALLLEDPKLRQERSDAAAAWARARFEPDGYRRQLARALEL